jgi:hypothetical protein
MSFSGQGWVYRASLEGRGLGNRAYWIAQTGHSHLRNATSSGELFNASDASVLVDDRIWMRVVT